MNKIVSIENTLGASLVVQWVGLVLPTQGAWVRSLVGEVDPTCMPQLKIPCASTKTRRSQNKNK